MLASSLAIQHPEGSYLLFVRWVEYRDRSLPELQEGRVCGAPVAMRTPEPLSQPFELLPVSVDDATIYLDPSAIIRNNDDLHQLIGGSPVL